MTIEEQDEKEFEEVWKLRKDWDMHDNALYWWLTSRRLLREKEANDRRFAQI